MPLYTPVGTIVVLPAGRNYCNIRIMASAMAKLYVVRSYVDIFSSTTCINCIVFEEQRVKYEVFTIYITLEYRYYTHCVTCRRWWSHACTSNNSTITTHTHVHIYTHTHTHTHTHSSYLTVIVVHEIIHGRMHHNHCQITNLLAHDPPFIIGLPYDDPLPSPSRQFSL